MKIVALIAILVASHSAQDQATFSSAVLGLSFSHAKAWQISTNKKNESRALIPIEGSKDPALLEVFAVGFDAETDIWQKSQMAINKQMHRQLLRQWEEQIMDAPMLLTKTSYSDKQGGHVQLTGLVYSKTPRKMMFKLTADPEDYDKAEFEWRAALQSLRTYDGKPLAGEDPHAKRNPKKPVPQPDLQPTKVTVLDGGTGIKKIEKGAVVVKAAAGGKSLDLHLPNGWSATPGANGTFLLRNPEVSIPVTVAVFSTLDSDPPARALFKASSLSLNDFAKVAKREETLPITNHGGASVARVWRTGTSDKGDLFTCDAVGTLGDYYFTLTCRSEDPSKVIGDRKAIDALLDAASVDPAP